MQSYIVKPGLEKAIKAPDLFSYIYLNDESE
jgi:hypothetical protein